MDKATLGAFEAILNEHKNKISQELEVVKHEITSYEVDADDQGLLFMRRNQLTKNLRDVTHALKRIQEGTYGLSEVSGKPIPVERLEILPWATCLVDETPLAVPTHGNPILSSNSGRF
jgi:DnaK suppressor protein